MEGPGALAGAAGGVDVDLIEGDGNGWGDATPVGAGPPGPWFISATDEAENWASVALVDELLAYRDAIDTRLSEEDPRVVARRRLIDAWRAAHPADRCAFAAKVSAKRVQS